MKNAALPANGINALLDRVIHANGLRTDAQLASFLGLAPSVISKLRHGGYRLTDRVLLRLYEHTDLSLQEIRDCVRQVPETGTATLPPDGLDGAPVP